MRRVLWPQCSTEEHACEMADVLVRLPDWAVFVAPRPTGSLGGFIELSIKQTAEGCGAGPVGYVEGWYVDPDIRREGIGRRLLAVAEQWALQRGCRMMASDADPENALGIRVHRATGFEEVGRMVNFRKPLAGSSSDVVSRGGGI